ncbi:helix-turn-helix domain-containing protein [Maricaulis sp. MIT060901]|uniref:helix-turn-helix domain-containing protein n=1 Tax=Maricaulis sp. MIT060901 TaxID=3096993 RepID=UPI00399A0244
MASTKLHQAIWKPPERSAIIGAMDKELGKTFIREWRKHRERSQEWLADAIGITTASLSRIENGKQPYNQRQLEQIAEALECTPADLLSVEPEAPAAEVFNIWSRISAEKRDQARQILETFTDKKKA